MSCTVQNDELATSPKAEGGLQVPGETHPDPSCALGKGSTVRLYLDPTEEGEEVPPSKIV